MKRIIKTFVMGCVLGTPALAQDLNFSEVHTEAFLQEAIGPGDRHDCIGASANQCMAQSFGGESTVGMGGCLAREHDYWDGRLNETYQQLRAQHAQGDAAVVDNLRDMQRAWLTYRDARCDYEYAQWGGGTGGGPAILACQMQTTAEQVFVLEQNLR